MPFLRGRERDRRREWTAEGLACEGRMNEEANEIHFLRITITRFPDPPSDWQEGSSGGAAG